MCITFVYINNDVQDGEYQVVIASNRDEMYDRLTAPAARWRHDRSCISGLDISPHAKSGGTWLGISTKRRKIASLLNISQPNVDSNPTKIGRGHIVSSYIGGKTRAEDYISSLHASEYKPFNVILMEQRLNTTWEAYCYSNYENNALHRIKQECFGVSNSVFLQPWTKVRNGTNQFRDIIAAHPATSNEVILTNDLINFLKSTTRHTPDPHLQNHLPKFLTKYMDEEYLYNELSRISFDMPQMRFGSRTNTVLLIDREGQGKYVERTRIEVENSNYPQWKTTTIDFDMGQTTNYNDCNVL